MHLPLTQSQGEIFKSIDSVDDVSVPDLIMRYNPDLDNDMDSETENACGIRDKPSVPNGTIKYHHSIRSMLTKKY